MSHLKTEDDARSIFNDEITGYTPSNINYVLTPGNDNEVTKTPKKIVVKK